MIEVYFSSGLAADSVLAVLALEALWLRLRHNWAVLRIAKALGAAVFIVLAVRAALVGAPWYWVAMALAASFPLHMLDLWDRFERDGN